MKNLQELTKNKELIVRKKVVNSIEKLIKHFGYDFRHDLYKEIVYMQKEIKTPLEERVKSYFDGYVYLLSNHKSPLKMSILNKFFYILKQEELFKGKLIRISSKSIEVVEGFTLDKIVEFMIYLYDELDNYNHEDRFILSVMFMNYFLLKFNIPLLNITYKFLDDFEPLFSSKDIKTITKFLYKTLLEAKYQDESYYKELTPISLEEVYRSIKDNEEMLRNMGVDNLYIHGSFAGSVARIDSDIDFIITFLPHVTNKEKQEIIDSLAKYYEKKFKRFIDILPMGKYYSDEFMLELNEIKKII